MRMDLNKNAVYNNALRNTSLQLLLTLFFTRFSVRFELNEAKLVQF